MTKLATHADMKIADNIKKAGMLPPPGAYSYTWIDYSVRNGQLEDKEDYEIRAPQNSSRQIGSAQHMKSTRTKFTVKDDAILEKWVLARQWKGQATGGNEIYKELERQVSRVVPVLLLVLFSRLLIKNSIPTTPGSHGGTDGSISSNTSRGPALHYSPPSSSWNRT